MKTPTLIVRLAGLYLLAKYSINMFQLFQLLGIDALLQFYPILGLLIGTAASWYAGSLARLLTFDSGD